MELETRECGCGCKATFRCLPSSTQRFISREHESEETGERGWRRDAKKAREHAMRLIPEGMVDAEGLAQAIGVSKITVYNWVKKEKIPFQRNGPRSTFFSIERVKSALGDKIQEDESSPKKLLGVLECPRPRALGVAAAPAQGSATTEATRAIIRAARECKIAGLHRSERRLLWLAVSRMSNDPRLTTQA